MVHFAFMDCETTGLHAARKPWDIALISRQCEDADYGLLLRGVQRYQWFVHPLDLDLGNADPKALEIGKFWERHPHAPLLASWGMRSDIATWVRYERDALRELPPLIGIRRLDHIADDVYRLTNDRAYIAGSNPHFDQETLGPVIESLGLKPGWHYHPVDVPSMCEGFLYGRRAAYIPPERKSEQLAEAIGVDLKLYERHTALGDCEIFYAAWKLVVGI